MRGLGWVLTCSWLLLWAQFGCQRSPERPHPRVEIPRPSLERAEEAVRTQLSERIASAETLAAGSGATPTEIAGVLGELGRLFHAYDFLEAARSCYLQAASLQPEGFHWPYYLGFLAQTEGRFEEAASFFDQVLTLQPQDLAALLRSAEVERTLGHPERARIRLERALELDPASAKAHQGLGRLSFDLGDLRAAVEHFEQAIQLQPQASALHYPLSRAYAAIGRQEEAKTHLAQRGNTEVSFPDPLIAAIDAAAQGSALHLTRGAVAMAEDRPTAALAEYRQALATDPHNHTARLEYGLLLAASGDLAEAERQVRVALDAEPDNPLANESLGRVLEASGDTDGALAYFRRAATLDPGLETARLGLAAALLRSGEPAKAAVEYGQVLELHPGSIAARLGRARARLDLDELAAATGDLRSALAIRPESAVGHLYLGEALQRQGDGSALGHYRRAAELGLSAADEAVARLGAGNLLAAGGDLDGALLELSAALELDPALHQARFNLAGIYFRLGRYALAAAHYRRLLEMRPEDTAARFYLGEVELRLAHYTESSEHFATVVAADPQHERARLGEAFALIRMERFASARSRLEEGLRILPRSGSLAHALARLLAACPQRDLRDGRRALELALAVQAAEESSEHAETIAMALAETGRFAEAVDWQGAVVDRVSLVGPPEDLERLRRNLTLYRAAEPCCAGDWWPTGF